ncbi:MAG TPA: ABC transporter permease [Deltaproteobacteria bacterium]|nr:ABC transporter permease [Deltaproteobacteria bacterium]HOI07846.1 ABC transporter permease [Deltaproteobacteria bacterium]
MKVLRSSRTALTALNRNKTRAVLTTLGIVIGIAAVIAMMEIGNGASKAIQDTISSMGSNTLLIHPASTSSGGASAGAGTGITLTAEDKDAILGGCPDVAQAAVVVRTSGQAVYASKNWVPGSIYGTEPSYLDVRDWKTLSEGDVFTERDIRNASKVCIIGQTVKRELFGDEPPVGRDIRINNISFKVVGVLSPKGANLMGMDQDDLILAPWTTIKYRVSNKRTTSTQTASTSSSSDSVNSLSSLYPSKGTSLYPSPSASQQANNPMPVRFANIDQIMVSAVSSRSISAAIDQITEVLRERHRIPEGQEDDFNIRDMTELTKTLTSTSTLMTRLLLIVALISLVVGGVGIMNIMLVSVTERTREIGLRMAVGAKGRDILAQFLLEAVILCLTGGLMGIALGRGISLIISSVLRWPTEISMPAIVMSVVVAGTVGIVFGFYPAWRASRLDPIEALRYE